jgi:hypothetical protein
MARLIARRHKGISNIKMEQLESRVLMSTVMLTADTTKVLTLQTGEVLNGNGHKVGGLVGYDVSDVTISNLKVAGSKGDGIDIYADEAENDVTLSNVTVSGFASGYGIAIGTFAAGTFSDVSLSGISAFNNGIAGISTYGNTGTITDFTLTNSVAYNNAGMSGNNGPSGSGIMLAGIGGGLVEGCTAYGNGAKNNASDGPVGIWAYDSNAVTISYCYSYNNKSQANDGGGFDLDGGVTNSTVMDCMSWDNFGYGYAAFTYAGGAANSGNTFLDNSSSGDAEGFKFWSGGPTISNLIVTGNTFSTPRSGYAVLGAAGSEYVNIQIASNTFSVGAKVLV